MVGKRESLMGEKMVAGKDKKSVVRWDVKLVSNLAACSVLM